MTHALTAAQAFDKAATFLATEQELKTLFRKRTFTARIEGDSIIVVPTSSAVAASPIRLSKDVFVKVFDRRRDDPTANVVNMDDITHFGSYLFAIIDAVTGDP